jgi:hypothetical protein
MDSPRPDDGTNVGTTKELSTMMTHPELLRDLAREHQRDLFTEAEAERLLSSARRHRRSRRQRRHE